MDLSYILNSPQNSTQLRNLIDGHHKINRLNTPLSPFSNPDSARHQESSASVCRQSSPDSSVGATGMFSVAYVSPDTNSTSLSSTQPDNYPSALVRKRKISKPAFAIVEESETRSRRKKCSACMKSFYSSTHLEIHEETVHKKIKRHMCPKCGSSFGQSGTLTRHILTVHEKRRDYQCLEASCLKRFSSAWSLKVHIQNVHYKMRPYSCRVPGCTRAFGNLWNRRKHEKNLHGIGTDNSHKLPDQYSRKPDTKKSMLSSENRSSHKEMFD